MSMIVNPFRFGGGVPVPGPLGSYSFDGVNDSLQLNAGPVAGLPFTIAAWFKAPNFSPDQSGVCLATSATNNYLDLRTNTTPTISSRSSPGSGSSTQVHSVGLSTNTWFHAAVRAPNISNRQLFVNGTASTVGSFATPGAAYDRVIIGARMIAAGLDTFWEGKISHVALWTASLTNGELASLAAGANPQSIQNGNLTFYAPLNIGAATDIISSTGLTVSGATADTSDGPTVYAYP